MTDTSSRDQYQSVHIQGVSSADDHTATNIHVDPTTNRTLVDASIYNDWNIGVYDFESFTNVAEGNGAGQLGTIVYKTGGSGGTTVATLTFAYDVNNKLTSITKT